MSVNKVILVGNVGKDPEVRYLDEGTVLCKFPMATSEVYKNRSGERVTNTEWHNIILGRGLAQVAEKYVKKGDQLYIEGRIRTRSYDDRDGNKKYFTEIIGDNMQMLGRRSDNTQDSGQGYDSGYNQGTSGSQGQQNQQNQQNQQSQQNQQNQENQQGQQGQSAYPNQQQGDPGNQGGNNGQTGNAGNNDILGGEQDDADDLPF